MIVYVDDIHLYIDEEHTQGLTKDELIAAFPAGIVIDNDGAFIKLVDYVISHDGTYAIAGGKNNFAYYTTEYVVPDNDSVSGAITPSGPMQVKWEDIQNKPDLNWDSIPGAPYMPIEKWPYGFLEADLTFDEDCNLVSGATEEDIEAVLFHDGWDDSDGRAFLIMYVDGVPYENTNRQIINFSNDRCPITITSSLTIETMHYYIQSVTSNAPGTYHVKFGYIMQSYSTNFVMDVINDSADNKDKVTPLWTEDDLTPSYKRTHLSELGALSNEQLVTASLEHGNSAIYVRNINDENGRSYVYSLMLRFGYDSELGCKVVQTLDKKYKIYEPSTTE